MTTLAKSIHITLDDAQRRLTAIVERAEQERGAGCRYQDIDHDWWQSHNHGCRYFDEAGKPMCLIGVLLAEYGITQQDAQDANTRDLRALAHHLGEKVDFDRDAYGFLRTVQIHQDHRSTWREALDRGNREVRGTW
ncbi:MAG: hypothetical protein ACRD0W_09830 [Acidimicrobiales bacterium]